jgi:hypothetical protein
VLLSVVQKENREGKMNASEMILAELLALRCTVSALAREFLVQDGSEALIHAEAQAAKFVETSRPFGQNPSELRERALRIVRDTFSLADHV